jgi:hypothetical protein
LFIIWTYGQICQLCSPNWLPNSMLLSLFWTIGIPSSYSYAWFINVPTTFCNSTLLEITWKQARNERFKVHEMKQLH